MIFWTWYAMITAMALHVYEMYVGIHLRRQHRVDGVGRPNLISTQAPLVRVLVHHMDHNLRRRDTQELRHEVSDRRPKSNHLRKLDLETTWLTMKCSTHVRRRVVRKSGASNEST